MQTASISGSAAVPSGSGVLSTTGASFGDNPFLELLVAQLRSQTPLEPVDNASFVEQLASYSSMQEQRELNDNLLQLLDFQGVLARLQGLGEGSALLGKEVEWVDASTGGTRNGRVDSVFVAEDGAVRLRVGTDDVDLRSVTAIREPGTGGQGGSGSNEGAGS
ncbi:MAG: flagellar hook capping protein [Planctomycetes bacterium]|nr:flagellar hook capping protein [Planctomycetota bacterium]